MIDIPVSSLTTEAAPVVSLETTTVEAARHLRQVDVPALVVWDATESVVGIVTASDIVAVVAERGENQAVSSFMSSPVVTVAPSAPIGLAADRMCDAGITLLPVVNDESTYKGILTRDSLIPYLSRHRLEINWSGEPLTLDTADAPDSSAPD